MKQVTVAAILALTGLAVWSFSSLSLSGNGFSDDTEVQQLFQSSLGWYGPAEISFEGCELRLIFDTGTTCTNTTDRKLVEQVFNFSEFDSYLLPPTSLETVGFILYFSDDKQRALQRARTILLNEHKKRPTEFNETTRFMSEHLSSGVKTEACYGYVEFLPDVSNTLSLFVDAGASHSVEKVISEKILQCAKPTKEIR